MRSGLVFTGEVKIDIRLLVSLESEECLERYILTVRYEFLTAFRTVLRRKIISGTVFTGIIKLSIVALGASVVRRQRVDF